MNVLAWSDLLNIIRDITDVQSTTEVIVEFSESKICLILQKYFKAADEILSAGALVEYSNGRRKK